MEDVNDVRKCVSMVENIGYFGVKGFRVWNLP
jgi:hypothetical protein